MMRGMMRRAALWVERMRRGMEGAMAGMIMRMMQAWMGEWGSENGQRQIGSQHLATHSGGSCLLPLGAAALRAAQRQWGCRPAVEMPGSAGIRALVANCAALVQCAPFCPG
jgi:hypothetical protein